MTRVDRFSWERLLRADPQCRGSRLTVLLTLGTHMSAAGDRAQVSVATLAGEAGCGNRTVLRALTWAQQAGYLAQLRRGHHISGGYAVSSVYAAAAPPAQPLRLVADTSGSIPVENPVQPPLLGPVMNSPEPDPTCHPCHLGEANVTPQTSQGVTGDTPSRKNTNYGGGAHARDPKPDPEDFTAAAVRTVQQALAAAGLPVSTRMRPAQRLDVTRHLGRCGLDALINHARGTAVDRHGKPVAFMTYWLGGWAELPDEAAARPSGHTEPPTGLPAWCGRCYDANAAAALNPNLRRLIADDGQLGARCPDCHPAELAAANLTAPRTADRAAAS